MIYFRFKSHALTALAAYRGTHIEPLELVISIILIKHTFKLSKTRSNSLRFILAKIMQATRLTRQKGAQEHQHQLSQTIKAKLSVDRRHQADLLVKRRLAEQARQLYANSNTCTNDMKLAKPHSVSIQNFSLICWLILSVCVCVC